MGYRFPCTRVSNRPPPLLSLSFLRSSMGRTSPPRFNGAFIAALPRPTAHAAIGDPLFTSATGVWRDVLVSRSVAAATSTAAAASTSKRFRSVTLGPRSCNLAATHVKASTFLRHASRPRRRARAPPSPAPAPGSRAADFSRFLFCSKVSSLLTSIGLLWILSALFLYVAKTKVRCLLLELSCQGVPLVDSLERLGRKCDTLTLTPTLAPAV